MSRRVSLSFKSNGIEMLATLDDYDVKRIRRAADNLKDVGTISIAFLYPINIIRADGGLMTDVLGIAASKHLMQAIAQQAPVARVN